MRENVRGNDPNCEGPTTSVSQEVTAPTFTGIKVLQKHWRTQGGVFGGLQPPRPAPRPPPPSTNSAKDRGQTERGSGCRSLLVRGFTQFVNERNSYSD
jgi:hypothetical protein